MAARARVRPTRTGHVRIDYRLDAEGVATLRHALVSMARIARAAGAGEVDRRRDAAQLAGARRASAMPIARSPLFEDALRAFDFRPNRGGVFSAHQMGSVRMGADAALTRAIRADASGAGQAR